MTVTLTYLEHHCSGHQGCGDIVSTDQGDQVRKTFLRVDGKPIFVGTKAAALAYAAARGLEVPDGA